MGDGLRQRRFWTTEEDRILRHEATLQLEQGSLNNWTIIAAKLPSRTNKDCRKRWSKVCSNVNRGAWDSSEDERLVSAVKKYSCSWTQVATLVGTRHADQCAKRWQHSLDPTLDHSKWQPEHEAQLRQAVAVYGRNWKIISEKEFLGRSTTDLKNRYDILERKRIAMERSSSSAPSSSSPAAALIACRDTPILGDKYDNIGEHSSPSEHGQEHDDNNDSMLREPSRGHKRLRANRSPARLSSRTSSISQTSNENRPTSNYNGAGAANLPWKNHNCDNNSKSLSPYTQMNNNPDSSGGAKMVLDPEMFPEPSNDASAHSYLSDSNLFSAPTMQSHEMPHTLSIPDQNLYPSAPYYSDSCLNDDALSYDEACFLFSELDPTVLGQGLLYPIDDSNSVGSSATTQSHHTADSMMFENDIMAPAGRRKLDSPHPIDDQLNNDVVMEMRCGDPREECGVRSKTLLPPRCASRCLQSTDHCSKAEREDGVLGSRTTLILEDVQPDTLRMVLDTLYKDKTKMSMEMWHN